MAWGLFKKIKEAAKKATKWIKENVPKIAKPVIDVASKAGTTIGTLIGAGIGNPQAGAKIGSTVQNFASNLKQNRFLGLS